MPTFLLLVGTGEQAAMTVKPNAVVPTDEQLEKLWAYGMCVVEPTHNPYNKTQTLLRRQCTFGGKYKFGGQTSVDHGPVDSAPAVVQQCVEYARSVCEKFGVHPDELTGAHVNWYPDNRAGLGSHQDKQPAGVKNPAVFSFTFILRTSPTDPDHREFLVTKTKTKSGKKPAAEDVVLRLHPKNGSLVVMYGADFQKCLWHEVPKAGKEYAGVKRINVTVRAWGGLTSVVE